MKKKDKSVNQMVEEALQASDDQMLETVETIETIEQTPETVDVPGVQTVDDAEEEPVHPYMQERPDNSEALAVLDEETKWERKERKKEEKIKAKEAKKRAKYGEVDDDTYYSMKARPGHVAFGLISIFLVFAGLAVATLSVYKLAIAPSYAKVGDSEQSLEVVGLASPGDSSLMEQRSALAGLATTSDALYDTWVEEVFEATASDAEETQEVVEDETAPDEAVEE